MGHVITDRCVGCGACLPMCPVGAVMGSKNLKAIVARGREYKCVPVDPAMFEKNMKKVKKHILRNNMTRAYRLYGTNANICHGIHSGFNRKVFAELF